ncbi:hypothetical protein EDEG_04001 [Edhazardia aedis USNM 41457]|uniref:Uncharacterized protein n=1 Tax=Edhazardia aedis (strain USNM 41457) TaxID=1003232 RepID=J8ZNU9_EDHAE|nr:hypothetical protein EDEG_04001 [Edhazardia aedis USNM 41457]|eukprot:EJW01368.1 hypothetical protein EDEG_04001 [Edhazardia aedis USNM 41457]
MKYLLDGINPKSDKAHRELFELCENPKRHIFEIFKIFKTIYNVNDVELTKIQEKYENIFVKSDLEELKKFTYREYLIEFRKKMKKRFLEAIKAQDSICKLLKIFESAHDLREEKTQTEAKSVSKNVENKEEIVKDVREQIIKLLKMFISIHENKVDNVFMGTKNVKVELEKVKNCAKELRDTIIKLLKEYKNEIPDEVDKALMETKNLSEKHQNNENYEEARDSLNQLQEAFANLSEIEVNKTLTEVKSVLKEPKNMLDTENFDKTVNVTQSSLTKLLQIFKSTPEFELNYLCLKAKNVLEKEKNTIYSRNAEINVKKSYLETLNMCIGIVDYHHFQTPQLYITNVVLDQHIKILECIKLRFEYNAIDHKILDKMKNDSVLLRRFYDSFCSLQESNYIESLEITEKGEEVLKYTGIILKYCIKLDNYDCYDNKKQFIEKAYQISIYTLKILICAHNLLCNKQVTIRGTEKLNKARLDLLDSLLNYQILLKMRNFADYIKQGDADATGVIDNFLAKISSAKSALKSEDENYQEIKNQKFHTSFSDNKLVAYDEECF